MTPLDLKALCDETGVSPRTVYFPLLGEFETDVYDVDVELAGLRFRGRFGVLPAALQQRMTPLGAQWVVGAELLQQLPVVFDLRNDRILLVQGEMSFLAGIT